MPSMPGFVWSSSPTVSPGPITRLNTPSGTPASRYASAIATAVIADAEAGLNTTAVAGHHRRRRRPDGQRHREVERADHGEHAVRAEDRPGVDRGVAEVVHRVVVERVVLGRLRVVADEVGGLLDLAQRLEPGLADLDRHQPGVLHLALADQLGGALAGSPAAAPSRAGTTPAARVARPRSRPGRRPRVPLANVPTRMSVSIGERTSNVPSPSRSAPSMKLRWTCAQPRLRLLQPRLVLGVQLLVVVAQGRVGDLDPLGGHSVGSPVQARRRGGAARVRHGDVAASLLPGDRPKGPATPTGRPGHRRRVAPIAHTGSACRASPPPSPLVLVASGLALPRAAPAAAAADFPAGYRGFHTLRRDGRGGRGGRRRPPAIVRTFSIGESYQGRELWAAKISDNVATDEDEPEVLYRRPPHADEHMSLEMTIQILRWLADGYGTDARITNIVDRTRGLDRVRGQPGRRRVRHTAPARSTTGARTASRTPARPRSAPTSTATTATAGAAAAGRSQPAGDHLPRPVRVLRARDPRVRDFVRSRVVGGRQQIRAAISFHESGRLVMWPYGYTHDRTSRPT